MKAIFKKEWAQYFRTSAGFVYLAAFWAVAALCFSSTAMFALTSSTTGFFNSISVLLLFMLPILTMRSFSEEMRQKTDLLLMTAPLSMGELILGKYLSAMAVTALGLAGTVPYMLVIAAYGKLYLWNVLCSYLAVLIVASALISIGMFISSFTESLTVSAILSYCVFFLLWMADSLGSYTSSPFLSSLLEGVAILRRYNTFASGIFDPAGLVYYLSETGLFLALTGILFSNRGKRRAER